MATKISNEAQLKYYKKKRNKFLFFIILPFFITLTSYLLNRIFQVISYTIMDSIIFVVILFLLFYVSFMKSKISVVSMYYEYFRMLSNEVGIQDLPNIDFAKKLEKKGYQLKQSEPTFSIYQLVNIDPKSYYNKKGTVVIVVLINNIDSDFYDSHIHDAIESVYKSLEKNNHPVVHQVTIMIKDFTMLNESALDELRKIVNVQQGLRSLIQLNIGLDAKRKKFYYLAPKQRYPNRMYFEAVSEIQRLGL